MGHLRHSAFALLAALTLASGLAPARANEADAAMEQFFATWDNDARVTMARVESLYAPHVIYYGEALTTAQVYANKRAFIRRWPDRRYVVVPGTVVKSCDAASRCRVDATLAYQAVNQVQGRVARGRTRVSLDLVRDAGQFKIVRETGRPVSAGD